MARAWSGVAAPQWWRHLRPYWRGVFWGRHRRAAGREAGVQLDEERARVADLGVAWVEADQEMDDE